MTHRRYWDGCCRAVVSKRRDRSPATGAPCTFETLECGHEQTALGVGLGDRTLRVCRQCVEARR